MWMWETIQYISTPVALIAFIVAIIAKIYSNMLNKKIELLKTIPESNRASLIDKELETYNISNDNLTRDQKFELTKLVISQRAYRLRIVVISFFVFATICLIPVISAFILEGTITKKNTVDLTYFFGKRKVQVIPMPNNTDLLNNKFKNAKRKIRIVAESGQSWLIGEQLDKFKDCLQRNIDIEVMLFDYKNELIWKANSEIAVKGIDTDVLSRDFYKEKLNKYAEMYNIGKGLKVRLHQFYMWTRFTIFDDHSVSFVLTPLLLGNTGGSKGVQPFYSEDPIVVELFNVIYESIRKDSIEFNTSQELYDYANKR